MRLAGSAPPNFGEWLTSPAELVVDGGFLLS
jgi:hypothetical protein